MKMKKLLTALAAVGVTSAALLTTTAFAWDADTSWYDENGTEFTISTADQLAGLAGLVNGGNQFEGITVTLGSDIDLGNQEWTPIAVLTTKFYGVFDGGNHTISGLSIASESTMQGLFGVNFGTIRNVTVSGTVSSTGSFIGGIAGISYGTIENCVNAAEVSGAGDVGGIVGCSYGAVVNCENTAKVSGDSNVGGIVGNEVSSMDDTSVVQNCTNSGTVSGAQNVGGIVGQDMYSFIDSCTNRGEVSGNSANTVGGVCGSISGKPAAMSNCVSYNGAIYGQNMSGVIENSIGAEAVIGESADISAILADNGFDVEDGTYARGDEITLSAPGAASAIVLTYTLNDTDSFDVTFTLSDTIDGEGDVKLGALLYNIPVSYTHLDVYKRQTSAARRNAGTGDRYSDTCRAYNKNEKAS